MTQADYDDPTGPESFSQSRIISSKTYDFLNANDRMQLLNTFAKLTTFKTQMQQERIFR